VKLGINLGYAGASFENVRPVVERADRLGLDSVWVAEAYGSDAVSVLGYLAAITERIHLGSAILQIPARTPSNVAMTAMTLDALSGGRFRLGLGMSGPQVVEGWHGVAYGKPLGRTREYVEVVRRAIAREQPLTYDGRHYQLPYQGADATGLGKPLKSILHPLRPRVPIYLAAIGPKNVEQTGEIADGWLPIFYSPERESAACEALDRGLAKAGRGADDVEIVASAPLVVGDDLDTCRDQVRPALALYIGGMGARGRNFYFDLACRYGFEDAARRIQDNYLEGRKAEAAQAVPDELVDQTALVGPLPRVIDRLAAWKESRVTTLTVQTGDPDLLERLAEAL
jgi:F420-dependent oxidoreductase-like protein